MNLTALLAALRGASTPEARKAILDSLTPAQRQALNVAAGDRAVELHATAERTTEQTKEMNECLGAAEDLQRMVEDDAALTQRVQSIASRSTAPSAPTSPAVAIRVGDPNNPNIPPGPSSESRTEVPVWRQGGGQAAFSGNPQIARAIAGDLYAHGLQDRQIDRLASREYIDEFMTWMRSCASNPHGTHQIRALNEVTIDGGAAVVPLDFIAEIIQRRAATRRVSSLVRRFQTSKDTLTVPKFLGGDSMKINDLAVQWVGAEGSVTEDTSLENWGNVEIKIHRGGILIVADRAWLEDASFDMEGWVVEQITDMYEAMLDYIIISGSGVGRPFGLVARTGTTSAAAGLYTCDNIGNPVSYAGLLGQQGGLSAQYSQNATYLWQRLALYTQVLGLVSTTGQPILGTPSTTTGGTIARVDTQLLGSPVVQSDNMAALGAGNKINFYGDFRQAYGLAERVTLSIEPYIDPAIQKKDQRGWYVRFRIGGDRLAEWALRCGLNT